MAVEDNFLIQTWTWNEHFISTDPGLLQINVIHDYLARQSYWAKGIAREIVERAISHSLCYGVYTETARQIGFARVITDFTTYAYLTDVFILPEQQGQGLGKWLISCVLAHPQLDSVRRWTLYTTDAHGLYQRSGFVVEPAPEKHMVLLRQVPGPAG